MSLGISPSLLSSLSDSVVAQTGLHFPPERWADLLRGIRSAAPEFGFENAAACAQWVASGGLSQPQIGKLATFLTVGETYFFREIGALGILEEQILPALINARRGREQSLRIWSAGCCTGEEPYSIAMILRKLLPDLRNWNVTILASDINLRFLRQARAGVYREWSFRSPTPPWVKEKWFTANAEDRHVIHPDLRSMVNFCYLNWPRTSTRPFSMIPMRWT